MITYFNTEIDKAKSKDPNSSWTVQQVLKVVNATAPMWRPSVQKTSPELRFSYEEESSAEQFFVPVVWTLIVSYSDIPWNSEAFALFTPHTPTTTAFGSEDFHNDFQPSTSTGTEV